MASLSLKEQQELTLLFIEGKPVKEIAKRFNISVSQVNAQLQCKDNYIQKYVHNHLSVSSARESRRINDIKDKLFTHVEEAIEQQKDNPNKINDVKIIDSLIGTLDRISRLNNETPTEITKNETVNYNVSEILKEFKTPEEKKAYLLQQLQNKKDKK